jgi:hypothetical protein
MLSYVLPIRQSPGDGVDLVELTGYLRWLSERVELIVVDGSDPNEFAEHHRRWDNIAVHVPPSVECANGKVAGVHTGIDLASHDRVVIADDDVRYDSGSLDAMACALATHDLVVPQNHFEPLPWHAAWDTSRSLLNRLFWFDPPGTIGVKASTFRRSGGYDGDVMFENLELIRTMEVSGADVSIRTDLFVARRPPTVGRFLAQRHRQAYDDLAQPPRLLFFLAMGPAVALVARRRPKALVPIMVSSMLMAELGRRSNGGRDAFARYTPLWAPIWLAERSLCIWPAIANRLCGGVPYRGRRIRVAAHSTRWLRAHRGVQAAESADPETPVNPLSGMPTTLVEVPTIPRRRSRRGAVAASG